MSTTAVAEGEPLWKVDTCDTCHRPIPPGNRAPVGSWCCRVWFYVSRPADPNGCWLWTGATNRHGYGFLSKPGKRSSNMLAHRAVYELVNGSIASGLVLMHRCDVPPCCNPNHLVPGTQAENIRDGWRKGRMTAPAPPRGEAHPDAVLTEEKVRAIRRLSADGMAQGAIGKRFGVSRSAVGAILRGEKWAHVK